MAVFKSIIDSIDGSTELAQVEREALRALSDLAEAKKELFADKINMLLIDAGSGTNLQVPISKVVRASGMARAYTSHSAQDIPDVLESAIGDFIEGDADSVVKGIFKILSRTLSGFLGATKGSEDFIEDYFVYATNFAIYRVDMMSWRHFIEATSLKTKIEQATAFSYVISNVDIEKIQWSDFVALYALQLDKVTNLTPAERKEAQELMRDTWNFLKGEKGIDLADTERRTTFEKIEAKYVTPLQNNKIKIGSIDRSAQRAPATPKAGDHSVEIVFPPDNRVEVKDTSQAPFRFIGQMEMMFAGPRNFTGTGTLIGENYVLTAAHNVYDKHMGTAIRVAFTPGRTGPAAPYGVGIAEKIFVPAKYRADTPESLLVPPPDLMFDYKNYEYDFALLKLDRKFDLGSPSIQSLSDQALSKDDVLIAGYPGDKPQYTMWKESGHVRPNGSNFVNYKIDTYRGQSGSSLLVKQDKGYVSAGVHVAGSKQIDSNVAVRLNPEHIRQINEWLMED